MAAEVTAGYRKVGNYLFPDLLRGDETEGDIAARCKAADEWKETVRYRAIHRVFLLVSVTRIEGAWACYGTPVPGMRHDEEFELWRTEGDKTPEAIARAAFPDFEGVPYAH